MVDSVDKDRIGISKQELIAMLEVSSIMFSSDDKIKMHLNSNIFSLQCRSSHQKQTCLMILSSKFCFLSAGKGGASLSKLAIIWIHDSDV